MSAAAEPTPAIVLGVRPLGESDQLVILLTPHAGKVRAAASGARRSRRRFAGGLSGGALGQARLARRARGLWRLESFTPQADHTALGRDLTKLAYVAYLCELTDALVSEPEPDPARFAALSTAILATLQAPPDPGVLRQYELRLLQSLGLLPALEACAVCGVDLLHLAQEVQTAMVAIDERRGGTLCPAHAAGAMTVPAAVTQLAARLLADDPDGAAREALAAAPAVTRRRLRDLLVGFVRPQLRRPLRSLDFFAKVGADPAG